MLQKEPAQVSAAESIVGASNSWAVSGAHSTSGKPLLANDPHLGLTAPNVWYFAHLHAPGLDAIGATLPGVPGIVIGRNERIAWGATNTGPDVQDLYLEKLDAAGGYLAPDGSRPFVVRRETIKVKGADDAQLAIRSSRHGPVISDVVQTALDATPRGHALALAWTALAEDDTSLAAVFKLARANNWSVLEGVFLGLSSARMRCSPGFWRICSRKSVWFFGLRRRTWSSSHCTFTECPIQPGGRP